MIDLETNEELTMQDNFGNEFINFKYLCIFFVILVYNLCFYPLIENNLKTQKVVHPALQSIFLGYFLFVSMGLKYSIFVYKSFF